MSIQHFKSLLFRSAKIQEEIEKEHSRPRPDWIRLVKLKKIRLAIKDHLEKLVHKQQHMKMRTVHVRLGRNKAKDGWESVS